MAPVRFDGKVAVVTGGGGGLGREYALLLASRGAKVVVNDLGGALSGGAGQAARRPGKAPVDKVVEEIQRIGGSAVADYNSVENGARVIQTAIDRFGRVDILINNAGILRDVSFAKMTEKDWDMVLAVHLKGSFSCSKAAWPHMQRQGYGRIVNTASAAGLYGNFGQTNYSAAKLALLGFTRSLAAEGAKKNIYVNCIAPLAGTRMTESIFPKELLEALHPKFIAPVVVYLCSDRCTDNGQVFESGAGWAAAVRWQRSQGVQFPSSFTVEDVESRWSSVKDFSGNVDYPTSLQDSLVMTTKQLGLAAGSGGPSSAKTAAVLSDKLFELMGAYVRHDNGVFGKPLVAKVGSVFHFDITAKKGGPVESSWTVDLKNGSGAVSRGKAGTADATFAMVEQDFQSVCLGKLNPQVAFMQGKMRIKGNMRAATKFTPELFPPIDASLLSMDVPAAVASYLQKYRGGASAAASSTAASSPATLTLSKAAANLKAAKLLELMDKYLKTSGGQSLIDKVGCVYRFDILPRKGASPIPFTADFKHAPGKIVEGAPASCDAHFTMVDEDFVQVATGKLNPQKAFMENRMKIKGNMRAAMKFTPDIFPKQSSL